MRYPTLILLAAMPIAHAQTPQELLQQTAEHYRSPDGYELTGHVTAQYVGSSWQIAQDITIFVPSSGPATPDHSWPISGELVNFSNPSSINLTGRKDEPLPDLGLPSAAVAGFRSIDGEVVSVERTGSETLKLNGEQFSCEVLKVAYATPTYGNDHPLEVTYWISPVQKLVLKKALVYSAKNRNRQDRPVAWTVVIDSAHFKRPPPQWAVNPPIIPNVASRKEWLGRPAPDFTLPSLDGTQIKLSSLRGQVIMLDFWSITCGPCIEEMPTIEALAQEYRGRDVTIWGVTYDPPDQAKTWLNQHHHSLQSIDDPDFVASDLYKVQAIPALVLIGRDGVVKQYWEGSVSKASLNSAVKRAMQQ